MKSIHQQVLCSVNSLVKLLTEESQNQKTFMIDMKETFERFVAETIVKAVLAGAVEVSEILGIAKMIESDLTSFKGSLRILLMQLKFTTRIFHKRIYEFFDSIVTQQISKEITDKETLAQRLLEHSSDRDLLSSQIFTFFAGG